MNNENSLIGRRFGRLVVKECVEYNINGNSQYLCICDCQNSLIVKESALLDKSVRNCGCFNRKNIISKDIYKPYRDERAFKVWSYMLSRCYNPAHKAYSHYGERGIGVCDEWRNDYTKFREFLYTNGYDENAAFGECTLDRIDNSKGYEPSNCRLVSMKEQSLNKTNNHRIKYNGKIMTVTEAAEMNGLPNTLVFNRLDKGWSMKKALETPIEEAMTFTIEDQNHTITEWGSLMNVQPHIIRGRLKFQSFEKIYSEWKEKGKLEVRDFSVKHETANGETHNRRFWAKKLKISEVTLRKLLRTYTMQEIYDDWETHDGRMSFIRSNKLEVADGRAMTRNKWAKELNVTVKALRRLLKERTMQDIVDEYNKNGYIKMYVISYNYQTADGITECLSWWSRKLQVNESTLRKFLKKRTMQEIVDEFNKNGFLKVNDCCPKFHTVDGITRGQKEWGKILEIPNSTLRYKLKKMSMQEIVDELRKAGKEINL